MMMMTMMMMTMMMMTSVQPSRAADPAAWRRARGAPSPARHASSLPQHAHPAGAALTQLWPA